MTEFSKLHPAVLFFYFSSIVGFTMLMEHPLLIFISLLCAVIAGALLLGRTVFLKELKFYLFSYLLMIIINPIVSQRGETTLFQIWKWRITVEAIVYGICIGALLLAVMVWFRAFSKAISSDKIIYLFGKVIPVLGLAISMILGFVDKLKNQYQKIATAQKALGTGSNKKGFVKKARQLMNLFSILLTWSLENAIETADAMACRGYGAKKRTFMSVFKMTKTDYMLFGFIALVDMVLLYEYKRYSVGFLYYPYLTSFKVDIHFYIHLFAFILLGFVPILTQVYKERQWKQLQSKV